MAATPAAAARLRNLLSQLGSGGLAQRPAQQASPAWGRPTGPVHLPDGQLFEYWDPTFTTRPDLKGVHGMVSSYNALSTAAGMRIL